MKIHINYAKNRYLNSQKKCSISALENGFDVSIPYKFSDIDPDFANKNSWILSLPRGAGYWLWKPYLILKTLNTMSESDWLMYTDSGMYFLKNP